LEATRTSVPTTPADDAEPTLHSKPSYSSDLSDSTESSIEKRQLVKSDNRITEEPKPYDHDYQPTESNEERDTGRKDQVLTDRQGHEISPIPEVAAVVSNTDDPSIPCMTFRFWVMGLVSIFALSFVNQ
ncbi:hypothetical protein BGZ52_006604, partial [Haplosporangium bisporale]